jgi:hypothetical protein
MLQLKTYLVLILGQLLLELLLLTIMFKTCIYNVKNIKIAREVKENIPINKAGVQIFPGMNFASYSFAFVVITSRL